MSKQSFSRNLWITLLAWPMITFVTIGLCNLTMIVAQAFGITLAEQATLEMIKGLKGLRLAWIIFNVVVFAPFFEEYLFRGLFWRLPLALLTRIGLVRRSGAVRATAIILALVSSTLFSAAHYLIGDAKFPDNAFIALGAFGLMQCALYAKTRQGAWPWSVILNHALFNAVNLVLLFYAPNAL